MWDAGLLTNPTDHVHHIDRDKQNNAIDNLEVKDPSTHAIDHVAENGYIKNQFGEWATEQTSERKRARDRERAATMRSAAKLLGMGYKEYAARYGWSIHTARRIHEDGDG